MSFNTPVLFLVFNRLDTTKMVFEEIRKIKPKRLYVAADGPRKDKIGEKEKCEGVRKYVLSNIDWNCKVKTLFRKENLGCGRAVSESISWFFKNEEMGIILEDDCLPDPSFFNFCEKLLQKYKNNEQIMNISGDNFQYNGGVKVKESYFFSKYPHIWGWASWRRAWKKYDFELKNWAKIKNSSTQVLFEDKSEEESFTKWFDEIKSNPNITWDVQWLFAVWYYKGLSVYPNKNLVQNIGFNLDSTHTLKSRSFIIKTPLESIRVITHPKNIVRNIAADKITFQRWFKQDMLNVLVNSLKKLVLIF